MPRKIKKIAVEIYLKHFISSTSQCSYPQMLPE